MTDVVENQPVVPAASSAPAAGEASPPAAEPSKATPPAQAAEPPKPAPETDAGDDGDEDEARGKRPSRSQRLQRKAQMLAAENEDLRRQIGGGARPAQDAPAPKPVGAAEDKEPQEADFNGDWFKYNAAYQAFHMKKAVRDAARDETERVRVEQAQTRQLENRREMISDHIERIDTLKAKVPDFDDAMKSAGQINLREEVADEILASEKSALIQYHLAKNPDKARELNGLTGRELARAVGRLEGAVRLPAAKKATEATPPVTPLAGGTSPSFDPFKAEMDEFAANWKAREAAKRRA